MSLSHASLIALTVAAGWIIWKSEFVRHPVANGLAPANWEKTGAWPKRVSPFFRSKI